MATNCALKHASHYLLKWHNFHLKMETFVLSFIRVFYGSFGESFDCNKKMRFFLVAIKKRIFDVL